MISFRGQKKKARATPRSVSFKGLIQNFRRASPPLSYAESPPTPFGMYRQSGVNMATRMTFICLKYYLLTSKKKKKLQVFDVEFSKVGAQEKPLLGKTYKISLLLGWSWGGLG